MSRVPARADGSVRHPGVLAVSAGWPGAVGAHLARARRGSHRRDDLVLDTETLFPLFGLARQLPA